MAALPYGTKSLAEIASIPEPADRLTAAQTLFEHTLNLVDPARPGPDGERESLPARVRANAAWFGDPRPVTQAIHVRNRLQHADTGRPVTPAEAAGAATDLTRGVHLLLRRLPAATAAAVRGGEGKSRADEPEPIPWQRVPVRPTPREYHPVPAGIVLLAGLALLWLTAGGGFGIIFGRNRVPPAPPPVRGDNPQPTDAPKSIREDRIDGYEHLVEVAEIELETHRVWAEKEYPADLERFATGAHAATLQLPELETVYLGLWEKPRWPEDVTDQPDRGGIRAIVHQLKAEITLARADPRHAFPNHAVVDLVRRAQNWQADARRLRFTRSSPDFKYQNERYQSGNADALELAWLREACERRREEAPVPPPGGNAAATLREKVRLRVAKSQLIDKLAWTRATDPVLAGHGSQFGLGTDRQSHHPLTWNLATVGGVYRTYGILDEYQVGEAVLKGLQTTAGRFSTGDPPPTKELVAVMQDRWERLADLLWQAEPDARSIWPTTADFRRSGGGFGLPAYVHVRVVWDRANAVVPADQVRRWRDEYNALRDPLLSTATRRGYLESLNANLPTTVAGIARPALARWARFQGDGPTDSEREFLLHLGSILNSPRNTASISTLPAERTPTWRVPAPPDR